MAKPIESKMQIKLLLTLMKIDLHVRVVKHGF